MLQYYCLIVGCDVTNKVLYVQGSSLKDGTYHVHCGTSMELVLHRAAYSGSLQGQIAHLSTPAWVLAEAGVDRTGSPRTHLKTSSPCKWGLC